MAVNIGNILKSLMDELVEPTEIAKNNVKQILIGYTNGRIVEEDELVEENQGK